MRFCLVGLLIGIAAAFPAVAAAGAPSIPFTFTAQQMVMVPVSVGKGPAQPFLLDTGGGIDVLPLTVIHEVGGKPAGEFTGFRLTGERMDLPLFTIPELRLGPVVEKKALVAGWDGLDKLKLAGILSLSFFRNHPFTLDMRNHRLYIETAKSLRARRAHGSVVPVSFDDLRGISLDLFAPFLLDGRKALCEVDTGSQGYMFALRYMDMLGLKPNSPGVRTTGATSILGHHEVRYVAPVASIRLAGTELSAPGKSSVLFEDLIYDCDLGVDFFLNRAVTFDVGGRKMIVTGQ